MADILRELERLDGHRFPREALQEAIARQEEITPHLLAILEPLAISLDLLREDEEYMGHFYALYLLGQFREKRAYPLICGIFSQVKGWDDQDLFGDFITEDLARVWAAVYDGNDAPLKQIIENPAADEFVVSSALGALNCLVIFYDKPRSEVMAYYKSLFASQKREPRPFWDHLISAACDIYPEETQEEIKTAFDEDLAQENILDWQWVEDTLANGREKTLARFADAAYRQPITDAIAEVENWICFQPPDDTWLRQRPASIPPPVFPPDWNPITSQTAAGTYINPNRKVGRNDPCICGSGKKFKKCCG